MSVSIGQIVQPVEQEGNRDGKGRWVKGVSGCRGKRKRKPWAAELEQALRKEATEQHKTLIRHAVGRAYVSDMVLRVILNKILPDLSHIAGDIEMKQKILQVIGMLPIDGGQDANGQG